MRAKAFYILIVVLCLAYSFCAPAVQARPRKRPASPPATHVNSVRAKPKLRGRTANSPRAKRIKAPLSAPRARTPRTPTRAAHAVPPERIAHTEPPALEESSPEPIHVRHNRKLHLALQPDLASRKASPADFLTSAPTNDTKLLLESTPLATKKPSLVKPLSRAVPLASVHSLQTTLKPELIPELSIPPVAMPALYTAQGHLIVPPALKGSHEILVHQNEMADQDGLDRVQNEEDLNRMRESRMLVSLPTADAIRWDDRLPGNRRYCRPWTARFLTELARAHYARFHTAIQVNSAVRTVEFQQQLIHRNGNAAPADGDTASPHLTGQAVDLAKHGLSLTEIAWLRGYLLPLVQEGKVDVEEEFQQACFHISVYRKYIPQPTPGRTIAPPHRGTASALAAAITR